MTESSGKCIIYNFPLSYKYSVSAKSDELMARINIINYLFIRKKQSEKIEQ